MKTSYGQTELKTSSLNFLIMQPACFRKIDARHEERRKTNDNSHIRISPDSKRKTRRNKASSETIYHRQSFTAKTIKTDKAQMAATWFIEADSSGYRAIYELGTLRSRLLPRHGCDCAQLEGKIPMAYTK